MSCMYNIDISRSDHGPTVISQTLTTHGPAGLKFEFSGCSADGKEGQHCLVKWGIPAGVRLLKNSLGAEVGYGVCCNDVTNQVLEVRRTCW